MIPNCRALAVLYGLGCRCQPPGDGRSNHPKGRIQRAMPVGIYSTIRNLTGLWPGSLQWTERA